MKENNMDQTGENNNMKAKVLQGIKSGQIAMRPKWHFIVQAAFLSIGGIILLLATLYLLSLVFFVLHLTGVWFTPAFGFLGLREFLFSLPWLLIVLCLAFIILLEVMVRRYAFVYRRPLVFSVLGVLIIVVVGSLVFNRVSFFHRNLFRSAVRNNLPWAGPLYRDFGMPRPQNIKAGIISEIQSDGFMIEDERGEKVKVQVSKETRLPLERDFTEGDRVVVIGRNQNGVIEARGIRKVEDEFEMGMPFRSRPPGGMPHFFRAPPL